MKNTGNVAFVTGGASGLGEATVRWFAAAGNKVVICDMNETHGKEIVQEIGEDRALFVKANVADEKEMQTAVDTAVEKFGNIHVLVACAGIGSGTKVVGRKGPHPLEAFKKVIDIDLIGTFNAVRLIADKMQYNEPNEDGERGVIIMTSSIAASEGQIGQSAYSAAKGGVNGLVLTCAREFTNRYPDKCHFTWYYGNTTASCASGRCESESGKIHSFPITYGKTRGICSDCGLYHFVPNCQWN